MLLSYVICTEFVSILFDKLTFSEMHSEDQHLAVLHQIRNKIWEILPAFNEYLTAIEIEPIAAKLDATESTDV
nr:hypothetical protein [Rhodopirellula sp. SM50]